MDRDSKISLRMYQTAEQERQGDFVKFFTSRWWEIFDSKRRVGNERLVWKDLIKRLEVTVIII